VALGAKDSAGGGFDDYGGVLEVHRLNFREAGLKSSIAGSVRGELQSILCVRARTF